MESIGKGLLGPNGESGERLEGRFDKVRGGGNDGSYGGNGGRGSSMVGRGRCSLAKCSLYSKDGLSGRGFVVLGGRSSRESKRA
ncbi:hypothetical protein Tco_0919325 [Tanacetum coccineum]